MISRSLIIAGNARSIAPEELVGSEAWVLGTSKIVGADRYYELHGLPCPEPRYDFSRIPIELMQTKGFPLANSMCIMLAHALLEERHSEIMVLASPLKDKIEYLEQRPALAFLVGYARGKGIKVYWERGVDLLNIYMRGGKDDNTGN